MLGVYIFCLTCQLLARSRDGGRGRCHPRHAHVLPGHTEIRRSATAHVRVASAPHDGVALRYVTSLHRINSRRADFSRTAPVALPT